MEKPAVEPYFDNADTARLMAPRSIAVNMPHPATHTVIKEPYSLAHFVWALLSATCCCHLCGIPALALSLLGYSDHHAGNLGGYRYKKNWAVACTVLAFFFGISVIILWCVYASKMYLSIHEMVQQSLQEPAPFHAID